MSRFENQEKAAAGELQDLYFSVDVETSGPTPLYHSMFSFGVAAIRGDEIVDTFTMNLQTLDPYHIDSDIALWWCKYPAAWEAHRSGVLYNPITAFRHFGIWVNDVTRSNEIPVFLAYPATFDFAWMLAYGQRFARNKWPFAFAGFCMQSYAAAILNVPFSQARSKNWPLEWRQHTKEHTHIAVEDAVEQAKTFIEMRKFAYVQHKSALRIKNIERQQSDIWRLPYYG